MNDIPFYNKGQNIDFKTLFTENEVTIPLFNVNYIKDRKISHFFNIGFFSNSYKRPATYFHYENNELPIILEHNFLTKGIFVGMQTIERSYPGLNIDWKFYSGFRKSNVSNKVINLNEYYKNTYDQKIKSSGFLIHLWYNHFFKESKNSLTVGFYANAISWTLIDINETSNNSFTFEQEGRVTYYLRYLFKY